MNQVIQSGDVTPTHLCSWTTDGVIQDSGVIFSNTLGVFRSDVLAINFNATNSDNPIIINLPVGYTRYRINQIFISGASGTLTNATCGIWTQQNTAGVNIVATGTALTITTSLGDTNNNMQLLSVLNQATLALNDTVIYFRVQTAQGNAATANVTVLYAPLP